MQQIAAGRGELVGLALWVMQESRLVRTVSIARKACITCLAAAASATHDFRWSPATVATPA